MRWLFVVCLFGCASPDRIAPTKLGPRGPECGHGALDADPHNCGECGHDCTQLAGVASATCVEGVCVLTCASGRAHCSSNPDDGCEADLSSPASCGACGNKCSGVCENLQCASGCSGTSDCGGQCVDVTSDAKNCGGCGQACPTPANGHATCQASACAITCDGGFALQNGACVSTMPPGTWTPQTSGTTNTLYGIWGAPSGDLFIAGEKGTLLHATRGTSFSAAASASSNDLVGVWGIDATNVLAVGWNDRDQGGAIFRPQSDGSWSGSGIFAVSISAAWGTSMTDVWAVGGAGAIVHNTTGHSWTPVDGGTSQPLWAVWGSAADDVYAVGKYGTLLHSDGTAWWKEKSGTHNELMAVWGSSPTDLFVAGRGGLVLHGAGDGTWVKETSGSSEDLFALYGVGSDVWAVGDHGTILHRAAGTWSAEPSGTTRALWSIWGSAQDGLFTVGDAGTILHR